MKGNGYGFENLWIWVLDSIIEGFREFALIMQCFVGFFIGQF